VRRCNIQLQQHLHGSLLVCVQSTTMQLKSCLYAHACVWEISLVITCCTSLQLLLLCSSHISSEESSVTTLWRKIQRPFSQGQALNVTGVAFLCAHALMCRTTGRCFFVCACAYVQDNRALLFCVRMRSCAGQPDGAPVRFVHKPIYTVHLGLHMIHILALDCPFGTSAARTHARTHLERHTRAHSRHFMGSAGCRDCECKHCQL
jgi:hypothetical protein